MRYVVAIGLVIAGIIHLLPLAGVLGGAQLQALYGVAVDDSSLVLLMRHRAVLFGILGVLLVAAAFVRSLQTVAFAAGLVSVVSFLVLAWMQAPYNERIARVVVADWVALAALVAAIAAYAWVRRSR
jgi:hypothetical protein